MMGESDPQRSIFYNLSLESFVPLEHPLLQHVERHRPLAFLARLVFVSDGVLAALAPGDQLDLHAASGSAMAPMVAR